jgi:2-C-methyl-D-erythritol 2,4-cyclodiphosphate synthase
MRVGVGWDIHRLVPGRPLVLGGVTVPFPHGLEGHSDADALCHALTDALLGAAAAGDIGRRFGVDDPARAGASSLGLLQEAWGSLKAQGYRLLNVDATLVAEAPRLAPHLPGMVANLAQALEVGADRVSVKATTAKGMGFLGAGEGIACIAVAALAAPSGSPEGEAGA